VSLCAKRERDVRRVESVPLSSNGGALPPNHDTAAFEFSSAAAEVVLRS
jgi:hypothetical protein